MDPMAHIIEVMGQAKATRFCAPPRLWKDLLGYHHIWEGMINPISGSSFDIIDTFSQFDSESFPCTEEGLVYGGLGSTFAVLERIVAIDHALQHGPFPGLSNRDTTDCPCTNENENPQV